MFRCVLAIVLVAGVGSAQELEPKTLPVNVYFGLDGTVSLEVWLETPPEDEEALRGPLGALIGAESVDVRSADADSEESWWEAHAARSSELGFRWMRTVTLDPGPLVDALEDAGYGSLELSVGLPMTAAFEPPSEFEYFHWQRYEWATATYLPEEDIETVSFRFGYSERWVATRAAILAVLLILPTLAALVFRGVAIRAQDSEAGYACMVTMRRYFRMVAVFWIAWLAAIAAWHPTRFLLYVWPNESFTYLGEWTFDPFVALGFLAVLPAQPMLYAVYRRFPGATWRRSDLFMQGVWLSLIIVGLIGVVEVFIFSVVRGNLAGAVLWTFLGLVFVLVVYQRYLSSFGLVLQTITDGELRERIDELSRKAGIPKINQVDLMYFTKAPMPNAFATTGLRIMVTDFLLKVLTKREVDAILAHEMGHLQAKHPQKQMLWMLAVLVPTVLIAVLVATGGVGNLFAYGLTERAIVFAFVSGIAVGMLARHTVSRQHEALADRASVAIAGDPEALISGLCKITRLSYMPLNSRRWQEWLSTHPSTQRRIERIADEHAIDRERVDELIAGETADGERYAIPMSAESERVFSTGARNREALKISLTVLAIGVGVPWLAMYGGLQLSEASPGWIAVGGALAAAGLSFAYQEWSAVSALRRMSAPLRKRLRLSEERDWRFVSFCPNDLQHIYDGFTNWDIGFLRLTPAALEYRGDGASFSVSREAIVEVGLVERYETRWYKTVRVLLRVESASGTRRFMFATGDARSMMLANRNTKALYREIRAWHGEQAGRTPDTEAGIPEMEVRGKPMAEFTSPVRFVTGLVTLAILGALAGAMLPVAQDARLGYSAWTALSVAFGFALVTIPMLFVRDRDEDYPDPLPGQDPFERK